MKLRPMRYGEFEWPHNPETLRVELGRKVKELTLALGDSVMQDYGTSKRVVQGEGAFYGASRMETFEKLSSLLRQGGVKLLSLPNAAPFPARFLSLELSGKPEPELIRYKFVFWEDKWEQAEASADPRYITAQEGDNLWTVASAHSAAVEKLMELNPQIQWPNYLREGDKVMLP